jgi:hypothetical protein
MTSNGPSTPAGAGDDRFLDEAVRRLHQELRGSVHRDVILGVVHRSRDELDTPSSEALPELVERLARQRLLQHVG